MVRANADHEISGCEDLNDNSKKSLGRNIIKSWLVGIFQSNGLKGSARNGSGILLQQQPPTIATKPDKETSIVWKRYCFERFCFCFVVKTQKQISISDGF